ncbi:putative transmembrane protein 244 [Herpailurus yagouaroundi]|uniref:putative transmembrane protein 244 n=1 Tax=Herpailurus yagouaroundi TaxID=1608482 RepID=UPI001AD6F795|nr:transmembrane protein 244 [Puma yagouaroundi]
MALQTRVAASKVVLQNLLICVILFYTVYYAVLGMCCMMLKVYELDVLAPFDFKTNPSWLNTNYKVLLISTQVTYLVCGLLFVLVVEEWVWDYAISVTILHVAITSTVMLEFPLTSHWWAALGSGLISMICGGQAFAYCLFKDNFIYPDVDEF